MYTKVHTYIVFDRICIVSFLQLSLWSVVLQWLSLLARSRWISVRREFNPTAKAAVVSKSLILSHHISLLVSSRTVSNVIIQSNENKLVYAANNKHTVTDLLLYQIISLMKQRHVLKHNSYTSYFRVMYTLLSCRSNEVKSCAMGRFLFTVPTKYELY